MIPSNARLYQRKRFERGTPNLTLIDVCYDEAVGYEPYTVRVVLGSFTDPADARGYQTRLEVERWRAANGRLPASPLSDVAN